MNKFLIFQILVLSIGALAYVQGEDVGNEDGLAKQPPFSPDGDIGMTMKSPNFFQRVGKHLQKGWHGFRSLFNRQSNRRQENGYGYRGEEGGNGYAGKEDSSQVSSPSYGKEPSYPVDKVSIEGTNIDSSNQKEGNVEKEGDNLKKGNQEGSGEIDERGKETSNKPNSGDLKESQGQSGAYPSAGKKTSESPIKYEEEQAEYLRGSQNTGKRQKRQLFRGPFGLIRRGFRRGIRRFVG